MPSANKITTPVAVDEDQIEGRYAELDGYTVAFGSFKADVDPAPFFVGLPDDRCQSAHWGIVTAGQLEAAQASTCGMAGPVRPLRGFGYRRELVRRPGQPVSALDLVGAGTGALAEPDVGEVSDRQALDAYRVRLHDLDAQLAEADSWSDEGRSAAARAERDALLDEIRRSTGLGGRRRRTAGSDERARVAVKKAISAAIDRIEGVDAGLADHLRSSIRTGARCSYEPRDGQRVEWVTD